ncbi:MAG: adenylate/guanylate cyclase domain-containing protein [Proteobacteria bacterium]|nr:adenylate/guanylate cyclase domain-containing protein [Pseudomonadota bacterium]MDA1357310.1 adenylate/guanylate cyclase domain-containing protein [Pseudomonadota bacterium]
MTQPDIPVKLARQRQGVPILVALVSTFGLLMLIAVVLVFIAGYEVARRNTTELIREKSDMLIASVIAQNRSHLEPARAQLEYLADLVATGALVPENRGAFGEALRASLAAVPQVSVVAFLNSDLEVLRAFRNRPDRPVTIDDWSGDASVKDTLAEVAGADGAYWGELFVAEDLGATFINVRMPVRRDGRFLGALIAGVSIEALSSLLASPAEGQAGRTFVLYGPDQVLAHPLLLHGYEAASDAQPLPQLAEFSDPVLQALWDPAHEIPLVAGLSLGGDVRALEVDGKSYVVLLRRVEGFGGQPWLVGVYQDLEAITAQFERLGLIPLISLGVLALALLLAFFLARSMSPSVRQLAQAAQHVRTLDLEHAPTLRRGPYRELNQAADAYNAMVTGLRAFQTYVPRLLVKRLMAEGAPAAIVSEEREVTVIFTDITGFTAFAEDMTATDVANFLNAHFTLLDRCVEAEGGTVDKYIGDSLMAFWGAPERQSDHAERACRAALAIARAIRADNERRIAEGLVPTRVRVGIHSGPALVGNIGAPGRINYTIIGDSVNTAERLEAFARDVPPLEARVIVLLSGETAARLAPEFALERLGKFLPPGRHGRIEVFRLKSD